MDYLDMSEDEDQEDPLKRIIVNKEEVNRERLANAIDGIFGVDGDTGELVPQPGYQDLDNKSKFVARLLSRRAALSLDIIEEEELGASSSDFAKRMEPSESTIKNYGGLDFVDNDSEHGGYYIPAHSIDLAISHLQQAREESEE